MKGKVGIILGVIALIAIVLGIWWVSTSNSIIGLAEEVDNKYADIQTNLQRRFDLIPNAVEVAKGYAKHESEVFTDIADARAKLGGAIESGNMEEMLKANDSLSSSLGRLLVVQENYPELKADKLFVGLQDQLEGTENRINVARQDYNASVTKYNKKIKMWPGSIIANAKGLEAKEQFQAATEAQNAPKVEF